MALRFSDPQAIADGFNSYFINVASKLTENQRPPDSSFKKYMSEPVNTKFQFSPVNENQILKCIKELTTKRRVDFNGFSTELIK